MINRLTNKINLRKHLGTDLRPKKTGSKHAGQQTVRAKDLLTWNYMSYINTQPTPMHDDHPSATRKKLFLLYSI